MEEKTFEEIKDQITVNSEISEENENIIANAARRELELERAKTGVGRQSERER